jgi:hypothetical protein
MSGNVVYTLYNGGSPSGNAGGARVQSASYTALRWNTELFDSQVSKPADVHADNVSQLSTPYLDYNGTSVVTDDVLYAAKTYYQNQLQGIGLSGWKDSSGQQISSPYIFPGTSTETTITYDGLVIPSDYWEPQLVTDFMATSANPENFTAVVTLTSLSGHTVITFPVTPYYYENMTLYNSDGDMIPAGTYNVSITVASDQPVEVTSLQFLTSYWALYRIINLSSTTSPTVTRIAYGYGQANTPISYDNAGRAGNIYFGIYEGDRAYYQFNLPTGTLYPYRPAGGDDFYWAGAAVVTVYSVDYMVFGGDSSKIYVRPVLNFANPNAGNTIKLVSSQPGGVPGPVRSSIVSSGDDVYFTSKGATDGHLWAVAKSDLPAVATTSTDVVIRASQNSTSTPVISDNGFLYVGTSWVRGQLVGTVQAFDPLNIQGGTLYVIYSGDPVQASPIVWSDTGAGIDYIYFTTNSGIGTAYCYSYNGSTVSQKWLYANTSGNNYSIQGMASDYGRIIWGDDGNRLYIAN